MKILIITSYNNESIAPFVKEQVDALMTLGCSCEYFLVKGKGWKGYLSNRSKLAATINAFQPDIIHAHYGLCGLLANLQRKVPVVTTYHGSDINSFRSRLFSKLAILLSAKNIFVARQLLEKAQAHGQKNVILPCGINLDDFSQTDKAEARNTLGWNSSAKYVLFAGAFDNEVKNAPLAKAALQHLPDFQLVELKGYSRQEVVLILNACDALLMTSHNEGSPQVIKEALACGCPIVSVRVGDVRRLISNIDGCYLASRDPQDIANKLSLATSINQRTQGRRRITELGLDNKAIASRLISIYDSCTANV